MSKPQPSPSPTRTDLAKRLDQAAERYTDLVALRAAVSLIPYVGSALDVVLSSPASQVQQRRFERLITGLAEAYQQVDDAKIDREFLESDEFVDFFRDMAERVTRSHGDEKLEALRNAFVNGTTTEGSKGPLNEIALRIAGDLTSEHMCVLKIVDQAEHRFSEADHQPTKTSQAWTSFGSMASRTVKQEHWPAIW